jgi:hypothetical protein
MADERRMADEARTVTFRRVQCVPLDGTGVPLGPNESVVGVKPFYEPYGIELDVFIICDREHE